MDMIRCDYGTAATTTTTTTTTTGDGGSEGGDDDGTGTGTGGGETSFYDGWPRNRWGIPEPPVSDDAADDDTAKPGDIDLLVVPGLAFDVAGRRLGQGKGYYDRFITRMRGEDQNDAVVGGRGGKGDDDDDDDDGGRGGVAWRRPLLVGVCLEEQFLCEVPGGVDLGHRGDGGDGDVGIIPVSDHDYPMDIVLTPSRTLILRNVRC
jgi:5-formyltetrahydrofolate cyclo-ligase